VWLAAGCCVVPANHGIKLACGPIYTQKLETKGIRICDDVWCGAGVKVLDGVTIEEGVVVAAGAVVNKSLSANSIYGGVPAKTIRMRD